MMKIPQRLYTAHETRTLDRIAIDEFAIPGSTLMARAADAVLKQLLLHFPLAKRVGIFCGPGNNGGDGFVLARLLKSMRLTADVILLADPENLKGDALRAFESLRTDHIQVMPWQNQSLQEYDVLVDAIFGSGLDRDLSGDVLKAVQAINEAKRPVLAVDVPTGLEVDTGSVLGACVRADLTVTFIGFKRGLLTCEGRDHAGDIVFDDLGVTEEIYQRVPVNTWAICLDELLPEKLPKRLKNTNKAGYGHTLVFAGNDGFFGAGLLTANAALRTGSGLVSLGTRAGFANTAAMALPEVMTFAAEKISDCRDKLSKATVVAVGPGLTQDRWAELVMRESTESSLPLIVDADALNLVARTQLVRGDWILTPHPGEAARLLGCTVADIQSDRFAAVAELARKFSAVVVLKGSGTIVSDGKTWHVCTEGNPGMASGGMGDALTGIIAGLVAQGVDLYSAAKLGVAVHARAGDLVAKEGGLVGMLASDVIAKIRTVVNGKSDPAF